MPKGVPNKNIRTTNSNNVDPKNKKVKPDSSRKTKINSGEEQAPLPSKTDHLNKISDIENNKDAEQEGSTSAVDPRSDLDTFIEDMRGSITDNNLIDSSSQILPGSPYQINNKIPKPLQSIDRWMYGKIRNPFQPYQHVIGSKNKKRSPIRTLIVILLMVCMGFILVLSGSKFIKLTPISIPTYTPVPTYSIPIPYSVEFPGGWIILLSTSEKAFTEWKPIQAEWFKDTTICKLIAIPWTKQIDAVYKTLNTDDKLILTMSNKDEVTYQIELLEISLIDNLIEKLNRNSPCMVIFLFRDGVKTSQVLISIPSMP